VERKSRAGNVANPLPVPPRTRTGRRQTPLMATAQAVIHSLPLRRQPQQSGTEMSTALMWVVFVAVPASLVPLAIAGGGSLLVIPIQHFYIVSAVSLMAALVAGVLAVTTIQIGLYRVLFLCLGFMSMSAIFAVHGLATPGMIVPKLLVKSAGSAVAVSAYLSLAVPGVFFAASYAPGMAKLERRLPFWPAGWLVLIVTALLVAYGFITIKTWMLAHLPLSQPPYNTALTIGSILLFFVAAFRQARTYRVTRLESQATLILAFVLLAEAAAAMVSFPVWTWGWWYYHLMMLAAVCLSVRALLVERIRGKSFRSIIEAALQLEVSVDVEQFDVEAVAALVAAVEVKDRETEGHNHRVAELCVQIGRELGMTAAELRALARSGLLHDIGKLGIPDAILRKHGPLDEAEWVVMRTHPEIGLKILQRCGHFKRELLAVLYHHERMDGTGYPHGLAGEAIPIEARIVAVADMYDVLTSDRPYRTARSPEQARETIRSESGSHLDARLVGALLTTIGAEVFELKPADLEASPAPA
jgi:HD-GYP domain-containing protein (c-di-GMP phosphodiesterase class II)